MIERTFIEESIKKSRIENFLKGELNKAGFTKMEMSKTPLVTRIILSVTRPGLAIGKGGKTIKILTNEIEKRFNIDNPQIEINEIKIPELDAKATVNKMISLLERGFSWKSVAFRTVEDITKAGAQGVELILKGKLAGKGGRKMKQRVAVGYMKRAGSLTELVDYAQGDAYPKAGAIGIKLRIIKPGIVFPDKVKLAEYLEEGEEEEEKKTEEKKEEEKIKEEKAGEEEEEEEELGVKEKEKEKKTREQGKKEEKKEKVLEKEEKKSVEEEKKERKEKASGEKAKEKKKEKKKKTVKKGSGKKKREEKPREKEKREEKGRNGEKKSEKKEKKEKKTGKKGKK